MRISQKLLQYGFTETDLIKNRIEPKNEGLYYMPATFFYDPHPSFFEYESELNFLKISFCAIILSNKIKGSQFYIQVKSKESDGSYDRKTIWEGSYKKWIEKVKNFI